jgi:CRP-like cAMP-binding protein
MGCSERSIAVLRDLVARHTGRLAPDVTALVEIASERGLSKGEALLEAGEEAQVAGIVLEGVIGEFYVGIDGKRKAKWLASEGDVVGSMEDLVRKGPARATIRSLTPSVVLCLPYAKLRSLTTNDLAWAGFFITVMEHLYRQKSEREYTLLMLDAEDRYRWFQKHHGHIEAMVAQEIVASYLGVTPVHLSRVRRTLGAA